MSIYQVNEIVYLVILFIVNSLRFIVLSRNEKYCIYDNKDIHSLIYRHSIYYTFANYFLKAIINDFNRRFSSRIW